MFRADRITASDGSPAHAGIDPTALLREVQNDRFPRTRGDRPQNADNEVTLD